MKKYAYKLLDEKIDVESRFAYLFYEITKNLYLEYQLQEIGDFTEKEEKGVWNFLGRKETRDEGSDIIEAIQAAYDESVTRGFDTDKLAMPEFQVLWDNINAKTAYVVDFDTDELVKKAVAALDSKLRASKTFFKVETGSDLWRKSNQKMICYLALHLKKRTPEHMDKPGLPQIQV